MSAVDPRDLPHNHGEERSKVILGSRGSELARAQTAIVMAALEKDWPDLDIEVRIIKTSGDLPGQEPIDGKAGRKGLFTGEIELALSTGRIDVAVHSAKDLPSEQTSGLEIHAVLARAGVEDVLVSKDYGRLACLPKGCLVATGSIRRQHQLRWQRPDLNLFPLRGNVPTRLRKLEDNPWEAIVLARAGLERLGHSVGTGRLQSGNRSFALEVLDTETFVPPGGQGVIALQVRSNDTRAKELLEPLNDLPTLVCLRAEREFLRLLHADCGMPVGVLATVKSGVITIRGQVFDLGAIVPRTATVDGDETEPEQVALRLKEAIDGH